MAGGVFSTGLAGKDEVGDGWAEEEAGGFSVVLRAAAAAAVVVEVVIEVEVKVEVKVEGALGALILVLMRLNRPPFVEGGGEATTVVMMDSS